MDSKRVNEAHPAFPMLIRQLSEDEARILKSLGNQEFDYVFTTQNYETETALFQPDSKVEVDDFPKDDLTFPQNVPFYFEHLDKLGLAGIYLQGKQEPIYGDRKHDEMGFPMPLIQVGVRVRYKYRLTELGRRFVQACVGDEST
jgi:hypothetical protein